MGTPPSFFWQGSLILIPVALLATAGFFSLYQEQRRVERDLKVEAIEQCQVLASRIRSALTEAVKQAYGNDPPSSLDCFFYNESPIPQEPSEDWLLFEETRLALEAEDRLSTRSLLETLSSQSDARSPAGRPLAPMATLALMRTAETAEAQRAQARRLIKQVLYEMPSDLTPRFIDATEGVLSDEEQLSHHSQWEDHEQVRLNLGDQSLSEGWRENYWFCDIGEDGDRFAYGIPLSRVKEIVRTISTSLPSRFRFSMKLDGVAVSESPTGAPSLASHTDGEIALKATLADPHSLRATQTRQIILFAGLITGAAAAAGMGVWLARRAFHHQHALNTSKSNFVASVSHELRAPIASMHLLAEGLTKGRSQDRAKRVEYAQMIVDECRRLSTLVQSILEFSRMDHDRKPYAFEETAIVRLISESVQLMEPIASESEISLQTELGDLQRDPILDGSAIQQALINLLDNAIKFSPNQSMVQIKLASSQTSGCFDLIVADQGRGIAKEDQPKIFERFFRAGSELRRETQGAGVGLSIVKHIVDAHRGMISVSSEPDQGTIFTLTIPLWRAS